MFWKLIIRELVVLIFGKDAYDAFIDYFFILLVGLIIAGALFYALYNKFKAISDRRSGKNMEP